jgi:hypothetical protein
VETYGAFLMAFLQLHRRQPLPDVLIIPADGLSHHLLQEAEIQCSPVSTSFIRPRHDAHSHHPAFVIAGQTNPQAGTGTGIW